MDNSINIAKKEGIKKIREKHDFVFSSCVMVLAIVSLFPVFIFLYGLYESIFYLVFYIGLIILVLDITLFPFEKDRILLIEILVFTGIIGLVLVFTGIGGLAISKNSENDIFLIFWRKGGVQFLITIVLFSGIIHLYLKKTLLCNYHKELINSYDEPYFIENLVKGINMSKWVNKEKVSPFKLYHSTEEKRLVSVASDKPLEVYPVRKKAYRLPWLTFRREYDSFAFVDMEQKTVNIEMTGNVTTKDGVRVEGNISVQCIIKDNEKCIKRIAINEDEEVRSFKDTVFHVIRDTIAEEQWCDIVPVKGEITEQVKKSLLAVLKENDETNEPKYCFQFRSLNWGYIKPQNKKLAETLERTAEEIADADRKIAVAEKQAEASKIERIEEEKELDDNIKLQEKQQKVELTKERDNMQLEKDKAEAQIKIQIEKAKLLQTRSGWMAAHPQESFEFLMKELDIQVADNVERQKLYREYFKATQYFKSGQINAINAWLERQHGFRIAEEGAVSAVTEEGQMLPTGEHKDEKKEGEEAKYGNNTTGADEKETKAEDEADNQKGDVEEDSNETSKLNEEETKPEEN